MAKKRKKFKLSNIFSQEDSLFILSCGAKVAGLFFVTWFFCLYALWIIISVNSVFIESQDFGLSEDLRGAFFDSVLFAVYDTLPETLIFLILLFLGGCFIGKTLLRPFEIIGDYCYKRTEGEAVSYEPGNFNDYRLLSRFSEFFFNFIESSLKKKKLNPNIIPPSFTKIHGPPFEKVFFIHFYLLTLILAATVSFFIVMITTEVRADIVDLFIQLSSQTDTKFVYFFEHQRNIFSSIMIIGAISIVLSYSFLCFHLYGKVSGAIFAFFSTMRSFMKGNSEARVHLIGYAHIRPYGRRFNKFMDHVERECSIDNNNVE